MTNSKSNAPRIHAGLALGEVFADLETQFIVNRKKVFETAKSNPAGFRMGVYGQADAYNRANIKAAQDALSNVARLTAEELSQSYHTGQRTVDRAVEHYKKQGFTPQKEPDKSNIQSSALLFSAIVAAVARFKQVSDFARGAAAGQLIGIASQVNESAPDLNAEIDMAQSPYIRRGIPGKETTAGEKEMAAEAEFIARDSSHKTLLGAEDERQREYGLILIQISAHPSCCPLCAPWQERILINDLAGGAPDGKHHLLTDAIAAGLFHFNCRHNYIPYIPGMTKPDLFTHDKADARETARRYAFEQEQRNNERMIRHWKREAESAMSDTKRRTAEMKVSEWQARQRALGKMADKEGVPFYRQYSREQIGGGTTPSLPAVSSEPPSAMVASPKQHNNTSSKR